MPYYSPEMFEAAPRWQKAILHVVVRVLSYWMFFLSLLATSLAAWLLISDMPRKQKTMLIVYGLMVVFSAGMVWLISKHPVWRQLMSQVEGRFFHLWTGVAAILGALFCLVGFTFL